MPIPVGINGLGRIGKMVCLQMLAQPDVYSIKAINATSLNATEISDYLTYDSSHRYDRSVCKNVEIVNDSLVRINGNEIHLFKDRDARNLKWRSVGVQFVLECTGAYLTTEKGAMHDVDYVIMSAPPKDPDITPTFIYGVNHEEYRGQKIVSASSCTTNCMGPMMKLVSDAFGVESVNFTTIHATTGSQSVVDVINKKNRTHRSIINNMIPHSTGAAKSIFRVMPELSGKVWGTSVRVPCINCSLLDINVTCEDKTANLEAVKDLLNKHELFGEVYHLNEKMLTSVDFMTTTTPTILDGIASMDFKPGSFKLMLWYDNEWSYSAQCLRIMKSMHQHNKHIERSVRGRVSPKISPNNSIVNLASLNGVARELNPAKILNLDSKLALKSLKLGGKNVVARFDFNVPVDNGKVMDDFRVRASLPSINHILEQKPNRVVLVCHFGRPKGKDKKNSVEFLVPILAGLLKREVKFLGDGVSQKTVDALAAAKDTNGAIYLLENIRFHAEETKFDPESDVSKMYQSLGDAMIADCFGCVHRNHMSVCHLKGAGKQHGYGFLIEQEVEAISTLLRSDGKKVLGIMGGAKIADKQPMIECLCKMPSTRIFVGGGLTRGFDKFMPSTPHSVILARDAYGAADFESPATYMPDIAKTGGGGFDCGPQGLRDLMAMIDAADVIFWNGCLGVIEDPRYRVGSAMIVDYLLAQTGKQIIIGGGETASLFAGKEAEHIYLSTGGGALLAHIQSSVLGSPTVPGLAPFSL
jgi:glyceraldehyde 3-phosphate dehydrogenase